jgi:drug/metabolite transporter (DMT)-like permease
LIILRPATSGFDPLAVLAVFGVIGFAGRDLATRAAPKVLSDAQLGLYGFIVLGIAGSLLALWRHDAIWPTSHGLYLIAFTAFWGILAYFTLTRAMRTGAVSVVTPFRYTRLIFAMILAGVFLAEVPDNLMLIGATLVIGSGLYTLVRTSRLRV